MVRLVKAGEFTFLESGSGPNRDGYDLTLTLFARSKPQHESLHLNCDTFRYSRCLRCPYGVMPRGLYTPSTVATSNTTKAPPEWTT